MMSVQKWRALALLFHSDVSKLAISNDGFYTVHNKNENNFKCEKAADANDLIQF